MATVAATVLTCFVAAGGAVGGGGPVDTIAPADVAGDLGDVALVAPNGDQIFAGDESTPFFVRLPKDATCPGDSANDQWRLNTFLIPASEDPLELEFGPSGPVEPWTSGRYPLFNEFNEPLVFEFLRKNPSAGSPGQIQSIPLTSFAVVNDNGFPGGSYRLGVACTFKAQTTQYWDIELTMTAGPDLKWSVSAASPAQLAGPSSPTSNFPAWAGVAAIVTTGLVLVWWRRARLTKASPNTTEKQMTTALTKESP